jgi:hypothetical protein
MNAGKADDFDAIQAGEMIAPEPAAKKSSGRASKGLIDAIQDKPI